MPKTTLSKEETTAMLIQACDAIIAAEPMLSEADRNLGDGDHGLGMQRGMTAAKDKLNAAPPDSVEKPFSTVGMAMMSSMGGASGAIFGTFFRNGGKALAGKDALDAAGLAAFFQAGVDGVKQRGGAAVGDKTCVDAMEPAAQKAAEVASTSLVYRFPFRISFRTCLSDISAISSLVRGASPYRSLRSSSLSISARLDC